MLKKALVLGATGGMGSALVWELAERGIEVVAFSRNQEKLQNLYGNQTSVSIYAGDAMNREDLKKAAAGVDVIFHAVNLPYPQWAKHQPILLQNILETAKLHQTKVAMVDNIYAYGKSGGIKVTEEFKKDPHTKKGKIRLQLENMAKGYGVPLFIAHFPDFYGPHAENTLLHYFLQAATQNKRAMFVGSKKVAREYIYTPDGAKAMVELALTDKAYGQNWNIPGSGVITGKEIIDIVKEYTGNTHNVSTVTKTMVRLLGLFDKGMREYVEMYYLNEEPVVLSGDKYEREVGILPRTAYKDGIKQTLKHIKSPIPLAYQTCEHCVEND